MTSHGGPSTFCVEARGVEQLPVWDDALWKDMGGLRSETLGDSPFYGRARFQAAGQVRLCELASSAVRVIRDPARGPVEDRGYVKVAIQLGGRSVFSQAGREVVLEKGGWTFYDTARPYNVVSPIPAHLFVVMVPKARLGLRAEYLERHYTTRFDGHAGMARIFPDYVGSLIAQGRGVTEAELDALGDVMANLLRLSIAGAERERPLESAQETLDFQIKHYVQTHIADPELSVQSIADRFGCSKRHVHRVFARNDVSLTDFIWNARLEQCAKSLRAGGRVSVSAIAFAHGFNNFSHFSRAFRKRFGCTPREYRMAQG